MVKIAFLFLLTGNPNKPREWKLFFNKANKKKYSLLIHSSNPDNITIPFFKRHLIKTIIPTKWGDISLVKVMLLLLEEASKDKSITHFHFLSDACVPLFPLHYIFHEITRNNCSFIEYVPDTSRKLKGPCKKIINNNTLYRQSQWMTLNRKHVEFFLSNNLTELFSCCEIPDELYFINTLLSIKPQEKKNIINQSLTYVFWKCELPRPKHFSDYSDKFILDSLPKGYLFLRKVNKDCKTKFFLPKVDLLKYLSQYKKDKCIFAPIGGWAGDSFITMSAHQIFKDVGLNYKIYNDSNNEFNKDSILFVCGSGNMVNYYESVNLSLLRWKNKIPFKKMVILPSTINSHFDVLNKLPDNTDIFLREKTSYHLVKRNVPNKNILLSDDIAFFFNIDKWEKNKPIMNNLVSLRRDCEKIDIPNYLLPPIYKNNDIAERFLGKCKNVKETNDACNDFLDTISKYKTVYTNRLHTAIAAAKMKRKVYFFPNSYYKNISVYQNSLYKYNNLYMYYPYKLTGFDIYREE